MRSSTHVLTLAGSSEHDNNYADNPFLTGLTGLGYTGAFWSHWREREQILRRARSAWMFERAAA